MDQIFAQLAKIGAAAPPIDGRLKVTGEARYAPDTRSPTRPLPVSRRAAPRAA